MSITEPSGDNGNGKVTLALLRNDLNHLDTTLKQILFNQTEYNRLMEKRMQRIEDDLRDLSLKVQSAQDRQTALAENIDLQNEVLKRLQDRDTLNNVLAAVLAFIAGLFAFLKK